MNYAVIMAGGTGKRLWPLSRRQRPKQVLKLVNGKTLLGGCFERLVPIFKPENILVLTNQAYVDIVRETLPNLPMENVIAEPMVRDTAGAIGLAAAVLSARDPEATMAVVTADQIIDPPATFQGVIGDALNFVNAHPENLITFGIKPTFPSTQYGYIDCRPGESQAGCKHLIRPVEAFVEKPDRATAQTYLDGGNHFWNAGLFVWKARTILDNLREFLPEATEALQRLQAAWDTPQWEASLETWFAKLPRISIDFAVMEKARQVFAIELDCQWLDLGSFNALAGIHRADASNNILATTKSALLESEDNILVTEQDGHLIAAIGVKNLIIAHSPDATLVCPLDQADKLKTLLDRIEEQGDSDFL